MSDRTTQEIVRDDLTRYGSQVVADVEGTPRLDQIIRWIEIDVPVRFLPPGIHILDTPGLGGLYPLHAEITQRFIPQADVVIFVLDATRPIIDEELKYLDEILKKTGSVFFIQTKIDLFRSRQWQDVQQRNEQILNERFGDRQADSRVWPISSKLLRSAASQGDTDFEIASRHRELAPALQSFLFRVSGWTRGAETLVVSEQYHAQSSQILAGRHRTLTESSRMEQELSRRELSERKQQFMSEWGDRGQKRSELKDATRKISSLGKAYISQFLGRGGELELNLQNLVDSADTIDALRATAARLADDAGAMAMRAWRTVGDRSWEQCLALLTPFLKAADDLTAPHAAMPRDGLAAVAPTPQITRDWYAKMKGARLDFMTGVWAGGLGGGACQRPPSVKRFAHRRFVARAADSTPVDDHAGLPVEPLRWQQQDVAVALGAAYHGQVIWVDSQARDASGSPAGTTSSLVQLRRQPSTEQLLSYWMLRSKSLRAKRGSRSTRKRKFDPVSRAESWHS